MLTYRGAIQVLKDSAPPPQYTVLREAIATAIHALETLAAAQDAKKEGEIDGNGAV